MYSVHIYRPCLSCVAAVELCSFVWPVCGKVLVSEVQSPRPRDFSFAGLVELLMRHEILSGVACAALFSCIASSNLVAGQCAPLSGHRALLYQCYGTGLIVNAAEGLPVAALLMA